MLTILQLSVFANFHTRQTTLSFQAHFMNGSIFPDTSPRWQDWQWQLSQAKISLASLADSLSLTSEQLQTLQKVEREYPLLITPFYLSLAKSADLRDPILQQCLPSPEELEDHLTAELDPLSEEKDSPLPRLVHRYPDRALFLTCGCCAIHCRHCMRKRVWKQSELTAPSPKELDAAVHYLIQHPEVRELLISGGDPLTLPDSTLRRIFEAFSQVPSLEMLRIGTRTPVALPQRFTPELCKIFEDCPKTIWLATHFNHPAEISAEAAQAVRLLMKAGVPVVNQCVLLKGINDRPEILQKLFTELLRIRIKPYYLFHGDPVRGTTCFRTGIAKGLEIMAALRDNVSGMAVPAFAFDLPGGGGKIRLEPEYGRGTANDGTPLFRTRTGGTTAYPQ